MMAEDHRTDNNKWVYASTGLPIPLTYEQEMLFEGQPPSDHDYIRNPNYGNTAIVQNPEPTPRPNNPGNPYFGKSPMETKNFWALIGATLPADRFKRLVSDSHFLWVDKVIDKVNVVDVDDKSGQFLKIAAYLTGTNGGDASVLMTSQELGAIMGAWK